MRWMLDLFFIFCDFAGSSEVSYQPVGGCKVGYQPVGG